MQNKNNKITRREKAKKYYLKNRERILQRNKERNLFLKKILNENIILEKENENENIILEKENENIKEKIQNNFITKIEFNKFILDI